MMQLRYVRVDVFTDRALMGNPLAVFTNARGVSDATMQRLAREMNLSETVFLLPPAQGGHCRLRIFTPTQEVPFAGHPVLGTAFVVGEPLTVDLLHLETAKGIVRVRLERENARGVFGWMDQPLPTVAPFAQTDALLRALGVTSTALPVERYDNGPTHAMVCLASPAEVESLRPDLSALAALDVLCVSVFAQEGAEVLTRVFAPAGGVAEDPATGSAAGPLALHLARHGRVAWGTALRIAQGASIGRPSELHARASGSDAAVSGVEVGGAAVIIGRGEVRLPL
jgi:trans-2,3-dihydro-3-hydroxyanthranilate isomerase